MPPKKTVYQKINQREHVLKRPNMYIGSVEGEKTSSWVYTETDHMIHKTEIVYVPALLKIFDEVVVNALDHIIRVQELKASGANVKDVKEIRVTINKDTGEISVYNSGNGIDVYYDEEQKCYIPELIFGHLLSSTNYDDTEERVIGGVNGLGSKCANIYSTKFVVETVDHVREKLYVQEFTSNMEHRSEPSIKKYTKYPYTKITFTPDFTRFGMERLSEDMYKMMVTRVYDACACTPDKVKIYLNDVHLEYKDFNKYVDLYIGAKDDAPRVAFSTDRWEVIVSDSEKEFEQVSFVNGIKTLYGGKHVDYIVNQITKKLGDLIAKRKKISDVKANHIKDCLFVFIKATIVNPGFDSQSKERLTTPITKFGSKCEVDEKFIETIYKKTDIGDRVARMSEATNTKALKGTDGKKRSVLRGVPKLLDATNAGTAKSDDCTLILTEGDSAASMALAGISVVSREKWGIFPLRGKVLNTHDATAEKIANNAEIANLKKILGLESNKKYTSTKELRYGRIMAMVDSDYDGSHIKGLLFNVFESMWPTLLESQGFICTMLTPNVKLVKGKETLSFYSMTEYQRWLQDHKNETGWTMKFYKGLGTNTAAEARDIFKTQKVVTYVYDKEKSKDAIDLAFNKKRSDDRKRWMSDYDKTAQLDSSRPTIEYSEFVNLELKHFSIYNTERAIPNIMDGFKRSIRKIMFSCFKRNLTSEIRVAQLAGYVSEHAAYHHGETSLQDAIVGLAQDYVGSNNINLLLPNGQFGTRVQGGKDSASARYIYTCLNQVTKKLFREEDSMTLLEQFEDGEKIEPEFYVPILPMILINGSCGIATGYSTNIPCYNPKDVLRNIKKILLENATLEDLPELAPWYRGFKGEILKKETGGYFSRGCYRRVNDTTVEITEAPVQVFTQDLKELYEDLIDKHKGAILKDYENLYTDTDVRFKLVFANKSVLDDLLTDASKFEDMFKMTSSKALSTTNMHAFDEKARITKYNSANEILVAYCEVRRNFYVSRKEKLLEELNRKMTILAAKVRFILDVIEGRLLIMNVKKVAIEEYLDLNSYPRIHDNFDYLIKMPIQSLTYERKEELLQQMEDAKSTIEDLELKTVNELWLDDLDDIEEYLEKYV
jgi:DNA topoisomerase-2